MAENLNSNASEWETGESNPGDFTADAVVEVLSNADDEEKSRVKELEEQGEERSTVLEAASGEDSGDGGDQPEPKGAPTQEAHNEALKKPMSERGDGEGSEAVEDMSKLDPTDPRYNPYHDPAIGSSTLADDVVRELRGSDKSPTLEACREAYKDAQSK